MSNRFRVSGTLMKRLEDLGLSPIAVLCRAGMPANLFAESKVWITTEEMFALYSAIHDLSGDPAIGLKLGSEERIERYDPIAIAALYTRSFGEALDKMARYKRLTCPEEIKISTRANECAVQFLWLRAEDTEPPALVDVCFAWVVAIGRRGTGLRLSPSRIEFKRAKTNAALYEKHFGCRVVFGASQNRLFFRKQDLDQPFITHNPDLLELVAPQLEAELTQQLADGSIRERVKGTLKKLIAGQRPRLEDVAREMRIGSRTLQRHLLAEQVTFHGLVEEARRELAQHYLVQPALQLNETAFLLGYEDPNSFIRAFHKWEGTSPGEWRSTRVS